MPLIGESFLMESNNDIIHAAYLKHCYIHALSKCTDVNTQCSSVLLNPSRGILIAVPSLNENDWYKVTSIQNLAYKAAERGMTTFNLTIYSPLCPTPSDAIAIREMGISTVIFHKEFMDKYNRNWEKEYQIPLDFLSQNNVKLISWSGQVSKKKLGVLVQGNSFNP